MTKIITSWSEIPSKKSVDPNRAKVVCILGRGNDKTLSTGRIVSTQILLCYCGKEFEAISGAASSGKTSSCGCKLPLRYHGQYGSPLYWIWNTMNQRCHNANNPSYENYGRRGVFVCKEWRESFLNFYKWAIANGWEKGKEIDRTNNEKGYSPNNCRFVTKSENNLNKRTSRLLTLNGVTKNTKLWAEDVGIPPNTICSRLKLGWTVENALTVKPKLGNRIKKHQC